MHMLTGCYSLDLYCDAENPEHKFKEFPHTYTGELGSACRKAARKAGWTFTRDSYHLCPKCKGRKPKPGGYMGDSNNI